MEHCEKLLHALWEVLPQLNEPLYTTEGKPIRLLSVGRYNGDAGPDFLDVRLAIGDVLWVGAVEMHWRASEWDLHGHQTDPRYNAVILHVVAEQDVEVQTSDGRPLVTLLFPHVSLYEKYLERILATDGMPPCGTRFAHVAPFQQKAWLEQLLRERLEARAQIINAERADAPMDWEEAFYRSLARTLGLAVNSEAMHDLALATPLKCLYKVRDERQIVEAILQGQSGLLPHNDADDYTQAVAEEYAYQASRFTLTPMTAEQWKFLRLRPTAFPSIRISQLAGLVAGHDHLFSQVIAARSLKELKALFRVAAAPYWSTHYRFSSLAPQAQEKHLGRGMQELLLLNSALPFRYAYALSQQDTQRREEVLAFYVAMGAEENQIIAGFRASGVSCGDAATSQALLQLYKCYCREKRCYCCPAWRSDRRAD